MISCLTHRHIGHIVFSFLLNDKRKLKNYVSYVSYVSMC